MRYIDLNCDMGESFGRWRLGDDDTVMPLISSANVACGFHAGDSVTMVQTVRSAKRHGTAVGAHPGLPDLLGFGRRNIAVSPEQIYAYIVTQIGALSGVLRAAGVELHHVKLHGALTANVETSEEHAAAAAAAIVATAPQPRVLWRASPVPDAFSAALERAGGETILELYPDLVYSPEGYVAPPADGHFPTPEHAVAQVRRALDTGEVQTTAGTTLPLQFASICVHGDSPEAVMLIRAVREILHEAGCTIHAP